MRRPSFLAGYALAGLLTVAATAIAVVGRDTLGPSATYAFFLGAVMLSSWRSGVGPGLFSTLLGTVAADYFLLSPIHSETLGVSRGIHLSVFVLVAALISSLNDSRRRALDALEGERAQLERRVQERTAALVAAVHDLGERVKEVTLLHEAGRLLNEVGPDVVPLARIVDLLPGGWQYPEITTARIAVGDRAVCTPGFRPTAWMQRAAFTTADGQRGVIEVAYLEERPPEAEGPFLAEERRLLESLTGLLRACFDRLGAEQDRLRLTRAEAARIEAQQANQAKDDFLATLSHELRAPLNVMLGWTKMLRSGQLGAEGAARGLEVLERSVTVQGKLIEDLLDVSRIVTGKLRLERQRFDLAIVARLAVEAARPAAHARHIRFGAAIDTGLWMDGDPARLQQVISNLLTNALKFTPEGGAIDCRLDRSGGEAHLVVRDSGIGIDAALLPFVFERFRQGDTSTTRSHGGLGLGLAIVRHLVERHGGRIEAASEGADTGATFTVTLPLAVGAVPAGAEDAIASDGSLLAGVRVLVVDDDPDTLLTTMTILEQYGALPSGVASAEDALAAVARERPHVLVSDIAMPQQDGYELIRRVRLGEPAGVLPAAALSARADPGHRSRALGAGFQEHLAKPVEPSVLASTIARLVRRAQPD